MSWILKMLGIEPEPEVQPQLRPIREVRYWQHITEPAIGNHTKTFGLMQGEQIIHTATIRAQGDSKPRPCTFSVWQETGGQPDQEIFTEVGIAGNTWTLDRPIRVSGGGYGFYVLMICTTVESEGVVFSFSTQEVG